MERIVSIASRIIVYQSKIDKIVLRLRKTTKSNVQCRRIDEHLKFVLVGERSVFVNLLSVILLSYERCFKEVKLKRCKTNPAIGAGKDIQGLFLERKLGRKTASV